MNGMNGITRRDLFAGLIYASNGLARLLNDSIGGRLNFDYDAITESVKDADSLIAELDKTAKPSTDKEYKEIYKKFQAAKEEARKWKKDALRFKSGQEELFNDFQVQLHQANGEIKRLKSLLESDGSQEEEAPYNLDDL